MNNNKYEGYIFTEEDIDKLGTNLSINNKDNQDEIIDKIVIENSNDIDKKLYTEGNYYKISLFGLIKEKFLNFIMFMKSYYKENKILSFIIIFLISILIVGYIGLLIIDHLFTI